MATRSRIAVKTEEGYRSIYCHWDGYPSYNGRILLRHYTDEKKIQELLALGDLSSLNEEIGEKHSFDLRVKDTELYKQKYSHWCCSYGRDRGEMETEAMLFKDFEELAVYLSDSDQEYLYVWEDGYWSFTPVESGVMLKSCLKPLLTWDVLDIDIKDIGLDPSAPPLIIADWLEEHGRDEDSAKVREYWRSDAEGAIC